MTSSYKDLIVWQKSFCLVKAIYVLTKLFPSNEKYGFVSQMRRASLSIPSNIAEGRTRGTRKDYLQFLRIAYSSGAELETQLKLAKEIDLAPSHSFTTADDLIDQVMRMINTMIRNMNPNIKRS